jgi:hypothetical protein
MQQRAVGHFRFLVFGDPKREQQSFEFPGDLARAEKLDADMINALDPNLQPFTDRGGSRHMRRADASIERGRSVRIRRSRRTKEAAAGTKRSTSSARYALNHNAALGFPPAVMPVKISEDTISRRCLSARPLDR